MANKRETFRMVYCSTFCNHGHDLSTGKPIGHECYILPVAALAAEREGNYDLAHELLAEAKPLRMMRGR